MEDAAWGPRKVLFEYWAHEASLLPLALHPLLRWRMARAERGEGVWGGLKPFAHERRAEAEAVLARITAEGPLAASDFDNAKGAGGWWGWSDAKRALEWLFWSRRITTATRRSSFERVHDLSERVLPRRGARSADAQRRGRPSPAPAHRRPRTRGRHGQRPSRLFPPLARPGQAALTELAEAGELISVQVQGWSQPAYLDPAARRPRRAKARSLLAPFDSFIWERSRMERLFGVRYRLEIYTPAEQRLHGYYVLPFLLAERLVARVDLKVDRAAGVLRVHASHAEPDAPCDVAPELAAELRLMADWLELDDVSAAPRGDLADALRHAIVGGSSGGADRHDGHRNRS